MSRSRAGHRPVPFQSLLMVWALAGGAAAAPARAPADEQATRPPTTVRFIDAPSSESAAARRARLKRECKGRPNAGACLGMTGRH